MKEFKHIFKNFWKEIDLAEIESVLKKVGLFDMAEIESTILGTKVKIKFSANDPRIQAYSNEIQLLGFDAPLIRFEREYGIEPFSYKA